VLSVQLLEICVTLSLVHILNLASPLAQSGLLCVLRPGACFLLAPLSLLPSWAVRGPTCGPHVDLSRTLPVLSPSLDFFVSYVVMPLPGILA